MLGDTVNYQIGKTVGTSIPEGSFLGRVINRERMEIAQNFFNKHGGKTIVMARFMPFIRTFIPFVAGATVWIINISLFIMWSVRSYG